METLLKRKPIDFGRYSNSKDFDALLITEARELLGYTLPDEDREAKEKQNAMAILLRKLDIDAFTEASVTEYKREVLRRTESTINGTRRVVWRLCCSAIALALPVGAMLSVYCKSPALILLWFVCSSLIMLFAAVLWDGATSVRWVRTKIKSYEQAIPEFAIQTAVNIKRQVNCEIFVESLVIGRREADPFLVAVAGGRSYYLEVWNEPRYQEQREQ